MTLFGFLADGMMSKMLFYGLVLIFLECLGKAGWRLVGSSRVEVRCCGKKVSEWVTALRGSCHSVAGRKPALAY
jgi:hypothetical protein